MCHESFVEGLLSMGLPSVDFRGFHISPPNLPELSNRSKMKKKKKISAQKAEALVLHLGNLHYKKSLNQQKIESRHSKAGYR